MMNTLVPTAVFNSYPSTEVSMSSIIMPPPAPTNPQMNPISAPHARDCAARFLGSAPSMDSLVVMTGLTMNLTPRNRVMTVEKPPMAAEGTRLDTQLPTRVKHSTAPIITRPFFTSRFLFLW